MTSALTPQPAAPLQPAPDTLVLANRQLRPDTDRGTLSRFRDDRWTLSPAIFEDHFRTLSINFRLVPPQFRAVMKAFAWLQINYAGELPTLRGAQVTGRLAVLTVHSQMRHVRALLTWLDERSISALSEVTGADLDAYLDTVRAAEIRYTARCDLLQAVRRLWVFRNLLPPEGQLPEAPPWDGKDTRQLLGRSIRDRENLTPRIPEAPMTVLLSWALRFVDDFSGDVLAALAEFGPLFAQRPRRQRPDSAATPERARISAGPELSIKLGALLQDLRDREDQLPGALAAGGSRELDWAHLARLLDCRYQSIQAPQHRRALEDSGLGIADAAYLRVRPQTLLDGALWLTRIRFQDVDLLVRLLSTACFIVIAYLSGMRPGEALSLRRGCLSQDPVTTLWCITGRKWKNAVDSRGAKLPEGQMREDPWIVVEAVAHAVTVVEQLHTAPLLFPAWILVAGNARDGSKAYQSVNDDLNRFVAWINDYCAANGRPGPIPTNIGNLTASRFRRTLAWFICRRPRGLVAAAIQYGHLQVQITQGYSGTYASGFPDDLAFERWLTRLEELDEADQRLADGEHVSGPAAEAYRSRVAGGAGRFAGHVIRTGRQARHLLANPSLQIHAGHGMTCVFTAATALCELTPTTDDARRTPDVDDCRPGCQNIARTERNITELRTEIAELRGIVDDAASPPIRLARERQRLKNLEKLVADHEAGGAARTQP